MKMTFHSAGFGRLLVILTTLLISGPATAVLAEGPAVRLLGGGGPEERPEITILSSNEQGVRLEVELPSLVVAEDDIDGTLYQSLEIPGGGETGEIGEPALPVYGRLVAIPDRAGVHVTARVLEEEEYDGFRLLPVQPLDASSLALDEAAYERNTFGDAPAALAGEPALMRGLRVTPLTIQPVRFNPAQGKIRVARRMEVEISFQGENLTNARTGELRPITPSFDRIYREVVLNYDGPAEGQRVEGGTYLLICPDNSAVTSRLQTLIEWRTRAGTRVYLATTSETGTTNQSIKNFIQNAYNTWEYPPEYVTLVGDAGGSYSIPTWYESSGYNGEGDHPYGQLEGGDILLDAHIGRLTMQNTTHLDVILDKIMGYEKNPYTLDPSWFTGATLAGDPDISGYSCVQVMQWIKTRLRQINYTRIDTVYSGDFPTQIRSSINNGSSVFCYRGWLGMSGWSNSNTYQLTNGYRLPFAVISTCGTGSFASENEARSEGFLRAGAVGSPKGAIGCIGTATTGTHTRFNNALTMGLWHGVLYEDIREMGAALTRGKLELYLNFSTQPSYVTQFSYWNSLMGDPAVPVWTAYPTTIMVSHPSQIAVGTNAVQVTVTAGISPLAGAKVCLWKGSETWAVGLTNAAGICELPVDAATAGTMKLTVTKYDHKPYLADIAVVNPALYVGFEAYELDDDASGESQGNSNGRLNPGETVELRVQLRNFGTQTANGVTAQITTDDPYVTLTDISETFGNIPGGATAWSADDFGFTLASSCPHGHIVRLGLDITSGANQWHSIIEVPVSSAQLDAGNVTLYNDGGNGRIDPGETVELAVRLRNNGGESASGVTAALTTDSPWVSVLDGNGAYSDIPAGGFADNSSNRYSVQASSDTYQGHEAQFTIISSFNSGVKDTTEFVLTIGQQTSDDPTGPDAYGYYAFDNTDTSYGEAPTYAWIEVDPNYGGSGTEIVLGDYGDYQDKSRAVDLPFTFQFYGQTFDRVTVCSNGWLAFGETYLTDYRNWHIPGAGSPQNLVAAFWDDLYQSGSAGVFQYYHAADHKWICEWSRLRNDVGGNTETFQVILYDPAYHPTGSGDGIIDVQYETVANVDGTDGYATVGIQNWNQTVGLLYTYFNQYTPGSAPLVAGRAIRFMPVTVQPTGTLQGIVSNGSYLDSPIPGADIQVLGASRSFTTAGDGSYGGSVPTGTFDVTVSAVGFAPDTTYAVTIQESAVTEVDFSLIDIAGPQITDVTELQRTTDTAGPYEVEASIFDASGIRSAELVYRLNGGTWIPIPMTSGLGGWSGDIPGLPAGTTVDYYVAAEDHAGFESSYPAGAPGEFITFFITEFFYIYEAEDPGDPAWTMGVPGDDATSGIWVREDPVGTSYNGQQVQPEDDHTPDPGVKCFVTGNGEVGGAVGDQDVDGGCTTLLSPVFDLSGQELAFVCYWRWYAMNGLSVDDEFIVDVSSNGGADWVALERVPTNDNFWLERFFDLTEFVDLTDQVVFRFVACDLGAGGLVEAAIDDFAIEVFRTNTTAVEGESGPAAFFLLQSRPNPFSEQTAIRFSLEEEAAARLSVYDVQGRRVRSLLDGPVSAGPHTVVWDGRDDRGASAPSGVYFYRLETGGRTKVLKLMRLE